MLHLLNKDESEWLTAHLNHQPAAVSADAVEIAREVERYKAAICKIAGRTQVFEMEEDNYPDFIVDRENIIEEARVALSPETVCGGGE